MEGWESKIQEKPKVYIDTSILISPLVDRQKRASDARSKLKYISNRYTIVIPQIVIGESISVIIKKSDSKNSNIKYHKNSLITS
ncbi:MAG: PIN domain-containing protein [Candidatus Nitrosocaldaceae archaeon]